MTYIIVIANNRQLQQTHIQCFLVVFLSSTCVITHSQFHLKTCTVSSAILQLFLYKVKVLLCLWRVHVTLLSKSALIPVAATVHVKMIK